MFKGLTMNKQEIFDKVFTGLHHQGFQRSGDYERGLDGQAAIGANFDCMYRGPNGMKCAAGFVIPDELYTDTIEGVSFCDETGIMSNIHEGLNLDFDHVMFINDMQQIHDETSLPKLMREKLITFAELHNLTLPEV